MPDKALVNPLLRWQAGNVEVVADNNGNIRPVKEAAQGAYKGLRSQKIDGIAAILTAITQVIRQNLEPETTVKPWTGEIVSL